MSGLHLQKPCVHDAGLCCFEGACFALIFFFFLIDFSAFRD
jgi:hypothetical protein